MKIIQQIRLTMTEGSSDKEYQIFLQQDGGNCTVDFKFGRRNGTLKPGTKTPSPVSLVKAQDIYNKLVKEKTAKGYIPDASSKKTSAPIATAKTKDATIVQLLQELKTESDLQRFLNDDSYLLQEKKDGERRTLDKKKLGYHFWWK